MYAQRQGCQCGSGNDGAKVGCTFRYSQGGLTEGLTHYPRRWVSLRSTQPTDNETQWSARPRAKPSEGRRAFARLCADLALDREAIKLDARFRGHERGAVAGMCGSRCAFTLHVFGSFVTATFTVPLASAITRRVFASNAMPVRRTPSTLASTHTPSPACLNSPSAAAIFVLASLAKGLRSTTALSASAFCR